MTHWKEQYESAAGDESAKWGRMPLSTLLQRVRRRDFGDYYGIFRAIAKHGPSNEICWTMYDLLLLTEVDYLHRYHCADALLPLVNCTEFEAVQLSAEWPVVQDNLIRLGAIVTQRVGPRR